MTAKTAFSTQQFLEILPLEQQKKRHLFDVYKLSILFDCIWYYTRGDSKDFYEKRKIDHLNALGVEQFYHELFANP